jgi:UDP-glucose 4-epimerase
MSGVQDDCMNILVTGGAGYIGSHAVQHLIEKNHTVIVIDNLSKGHREALPSAVPFYNCSIEDSDTVKTVLREHSIEAVMNFAAFIEVGESVQDPFKYYQNNFSATLKLLKTLVENNVKKFVFSSTAAVYGNPIHVPITEMHPQSPLNPYGQSKLMVESAIADFSKAHGLGYAILRYFNVAGAHPNGHIGEDHKPESHLIPRILLAALDSEVILPIYGSDYPTKDGTCVRDYVHVQDLVSAHSLAIEQIKPGHGNIYNLGSESGYTVKEVIEACKKVVQRDIKVEVHDRRSGDSAVLVASSSRIKTELDWSPKYPDLETIISHAWKWHKNHPQGYLKS